MNMRGEPVEKIANKAVLQQFAERKDPSLQSPPPAGPTLKVSVLFGLPRAISHFQLHFEC